MKTLTIRGLPDEVHERLKKRAKANRRSLNQELIERLINAVADGDKAAKVDEFLAATELFRAKLKQPLSGKQIRNAIEEGRG